MENLKVIANFLPFFGPNEPSHQSPRPPKRTRQAEWAMDNFKFHKHNC